MIGGGGVYNFCAGFAARDAHASMILYTVDVEPRSRIHRLLRELSMVTYNILLCISIHTISRSLFRNY